MNSKLRRGLLSLGLAVIVIVVATYSWLRLKPAALPEGFVAGNGRIESTAVDIATKSAGRVRKYWSRKVTSSTRERSSRAWIPRRWKPSSATAGEGQAGRKRQFDGDGGGRAAPGGHGQRRCAGHAKAPGEGHGARHGDSGRE
jgi:hypothetical protein